MGPTPQTEKVPRRTYTINEFTEAFRLSRATTFRLIASGKLKSVRVMGRRLILADSAEALIAEAA
jgi:excisionase family DNA binding protein